MSNKTLVIVESPAKAKTINRYLGKNYSVEASVGHIKDLVKFKLGVDIENDFKPKYITIKGKGDIIKKLKQLAKNSKNVYIATDPDREGEAIAWHIAEEIKKINDNVKRVIFNEITKNGVKDGLEEPRDLNENLFMSQLARRVMDRLIGFKVSPFLSQAMILKTSKALSAGRVQSVALRLICEREEAIRNFKPIEYWNILGKFNSEGEIFNAKLNAIGGKNLKNPEGSAKASDKKEQNKIDEKLAKLNYIKSEKEAEDIIKALKNEDFEISQITKKQIKRKPQPPFTTSALQQEASKRLGFSNKKTMSLAQRLYEGVNVKGEGAVGLITYMRTDSVRVSKQSQSAAKDYIEKEYGKDYAPAKPPFYATKSKTAQDAHEAIRPTSMEFTPKEVKKLLNRDLGRLYELIFTRFIASQMKPAVYDNTKVDIKSGKYTFRATGSILKFKGFLAAYKEAKENGYQKDSSELPSNLKKGMEVDLEKLTKNRSETKPPARYNSASIVKELDEKGIGRPSTYASIIGTLLDRNYVDTANKSFEPTQLGEEVNESLVKNFPELFNVKFTANMEENLDKVAHGDKTYEKILNHFYDPFQTSLKKAEKSGDIPEIKCEKCGAPMVIRVSRRGRFLGCSNYPDCKFTKPLPKDEERMKKEPEIAEGITCDLCGSQMVIRESRYGKFYGCSQYPKCKGTKPISTNVQCPKCEKGKVVEKFSPKSKKKFWGCSRYPDCDYITRYEPVNKECSKCGFYYLEVRYKKKDGDWVKYLRCPECGTSFDA